MKGPVQIYGEIRSQESTAVFLGQTSRFLFPSQTLSRCPLPEPWETLGGAPGSGPQAPSSSGPGAVGTQGGGLGSPDRPWQGRPAGAAANIDFGKHHFAPSAGRGRCALTRGAEAAAPHLDEAISGDRWLRRELWPLGAPK